jgi:hypothetical protein
MIRSSLAVALLALASVAVANEPADIAPWPFTQICALGPSHPLNGVCWDAAFAIDTVVECPGARHRVLHDYRGERGLVVLYTRPAGEPRRLAASFGFFARGFVSAQPARVQYYVSLADGDTAELLDFESCDCHTRAADGCNGWLPGVVP